MLIYIKIIIFLTPIPFCNATINISLITPLPLCLVLIPNFSPSTLTYKISEYSIFKKNIRTSHFSVLSNKKNHQNFSPLSLKNNNSTHPSTHINNLKRRIPHLHMSLIRILEKDEREMNISIQ